MKQLFLLFSLSLLLSTAMANQEKHLYGYVEKALLVDKNLLLSAKLDTGAKSASLNATHIQEIEEDGVPYLRFIIPTKTGDVPFKSPYIGKVKIKVRAGERLHPTEKAKPLARPVIKIKIRIGDEEQLVVVNLANRKRFNYPLLLGRDAIKQFKGIIDPALTFTTKTEPLKTS
jgi:hypothetical protein